MYSVRPPDIVYRMGRQRVLDCGDRLLRITVKFRLAYRNLFITLLVFFKLEEPNHRGCLRSTETDFVGQLVSAEIIEAKIVHSLYCYYSGSWCALRYKLYPVSPFLRCGGQ
jgi:hypothetical protein